MNIENIAALAAQLQSLGFDNGSTGLLKRISFKPEGFIISQKIPKAGDQFFFYLFFERDSQHNSYSLKYYDATLQKETVLGETQVNGVRPLELASRMADIDWKEAFDLDAGKQWNTADKASWEKELKVERVVDALRELETTEEGIVMATTLKLKYWNGLPYQDMVGTISPVKNKSDVSQRFYISEGNAGISVDEAIRFLQNRWLEKQMQSKRKLPDDSNPVDTENEANSTSSEGLLQKNKMRNTKGNRKYKVRS